MSIVETSRLILRPHRLDDFTDCAAMWADPAVVQHITGRPSTDSETWSRILRYAGHWALLDYGYWAVEEKATGRYVGDIGFSDFRRELEPSIKGLPEIGWVLASRVHGKGYATEAVTAAVAWGDTHFAADRTVCIVAPDNAASLRVAAKSGYREVCRTTYLGNPTVLFERRRP